jgi:hypothetical protein
MLNNFLIIYQPISIVIQNSNNKAFKNKRLLILEEEIVYLKNTLLILKVFVKATNKLQADKYPTIYYTVPMLYNIYIQLERIKGELIVSYIINLFILYINFYRNFHLLLKLLT